MTQLSDVAESELKPGDVVADSALLYDAYHALGTINYIATGSSPKTALYALEQFVQAIVLSPRVGFFYPRAPYYLQPGFTGFLKEIRSVAPFFVPLEISYELEREIAAGAHELLQSCGPILQPLTAALEKSIEERERLHGPVKEGLTAAHLPTEWIPDIPMYMGSRIHLDVFDRGSGRGMLSRLDFGTESTAIGLLAFLSTCYILYASNASLSYTPHAVRAPIVASLLATGASQFPNFAESALRHIAGARGQLAQRINTFYGLEVVSLQLPLILNFVLKESKDRGAILKTALEVRESRSAKAFRTWCAHINAAMADDELVIVNDALVEVESLCGALLKEFGVGAEEVGVKLGIFQFRQRVPRVLLKAPSFLQQRHLIFLNDLFRDSMRAAEVLSRLKALPAEVVVRSWLDEYMVVDSAGLPVEGALIEVNAVDRELNDFKLAARTTLGGLCRLHFKNVKFSDGNCQLSVRVSHPGHDVHATTLFHHVSEGGSSITVKLPW